MNKNFQSYAHQDLSLEEIKLYAKQYDDVDMWKLYGMDEDNFPFLIWESEDDYSVMFWSKYSGMMACANDDEVFDYAFASWLKENAHPVFSSFTDAQAYAEEHKWPRKEQNA